MRIRKNDNTSVFLQTKLNLISHLHETTNLCHLNQSPWDIITFPHTHESNLLCDLNQSPWDLITFPTPSSHSFHQFDEFDTRYYDNFAESWSSVDSIGPVQRGALTKSSFDCEHDIVGVNGNVDDKIKNCELFGKEFDFGLMKGDEEIVKNDNILCEDQNDPLLITNHTLAITSKQNEYYYYSECEPDIDNFNRNVDDKIKICELDKNEVDLKFMKGDEKIVQNDNIVCEDQNDVIWKTNKVEPKPVSGSRSTKKRTVAMTSKQNEYYYYSGFGPSYSWGKKRGELGNKGTTFNANDTTVTNNSNVYDHTSGVAYDMGLKEEQKRVESREVRPKQEKEKAVKKRGRKLTNARSLKPLM